MSYNSTCLLAAVNATIHSICLSQPLAGVRFKSGAVWKQPAGTLLEMPVLQAVALPAVPQHLPRFALNTVPGLAMGRSRSETATKARAPQLQTQIASAWGTAPEGLCLPAAQLLRSWDWNGNKKFFPSGRAWRELKKDGGRVRDLRYAPLGQSCGCAALTLGCCFH